MWAPAGFSDHSKTDHTLKFKRVQQCTRFFLFTAGCELREVLFFDMGCGPLQGPFWGRSLFPRPSRPSAWTPWGFLQVKVSDLAQVFDLH